MKRNLKMSMLVLVLLLAVGFAAVSTTLVINGTANFGTNEEEFDVYWQIAQSYDAMQEYRLWEKAAEKNPEEADEYKKHMEACRQILKKNVQECADDDWLRVLEGFAEK